jgi:hypothetical protein
MTAPSLHHCAPTYAPLSRFFARKLNLSKFPAPKLDLVEVLLSKFRMAKILAVLAHDGLKKAPIPADRGFVPHSVWN